MLEDWSKLPWQAHTVVAEETDAQALETTQIKEASQTSAGLKASQLYGVKRGGNVMRAAPLRATDRMEAHSHG